MIGRTLLHYRITEKLGAGGMGEVFRATDTKLGRDVAIKVLPEAFARDKERLARFEREARVLASLNHQNIAAIYGFEQAEGVHFLVLEYVPGPTLAQMVAASAIEIEEALRVSTEIVEALEEAHGKGVMHRDLKPANVKVSPEGKVKVLDFGLAKALSDEPVEGDPSGSPTLTIAATRAGVILGTAAYMSPEQARGRRLDRRTDIWSFGCVLYEMLAGSSAFGAGNITDTIAAVVRAEPDWSRLPPGTPAGVHRLLRRCLQKDPKDRLRDIGDARFELLQSAAEPPPAAPPVAAPPRPAPRWPLLAGGALVGALAAGLAAWALLGRPAPPPASPVRFVIPLPPNESIEATLTGSPLALSPDGTKLVYVGRRGGALQLYLRSFDQLETKALAGTEGAYSPFFSPDGEWIAFTQDSRLKKLPIAGGAPVALCSSRLVGGGAWGPDGTIVFHDVVGRGLLRVPATGGTPQVVSTPKGEIDHRFPQFLPDGKSILFTLVTGGDDNRLAVLSLDTGQRREVPEGGGSGRYLASGHLVFMRGGALFAAPFDPARLQVAQPAMAVLEGIASNNLGSAVAFSDSGSLAYVPGVVGTEDALAWVDRKGSVQPLAAPRRAFAHPRLSPDGQRVAVLIRVGNPDIWVHQVARGALSRLTVEAGEDETPIWSPDGKTIAYSSSRAGQPRAVFSRPADGSGAEQRLWSSDHHIHLNSWSPDGKTIAFQESNPTTSWDLWVLPVDGERKARPFLQTQFEEMAAAFSPDGRWLAYQSNETGRFEIYVQPYPGPGAKTQVSTDGGTEPLWRPNGRELFFRSGDKMMAVSIDTRSGFSPGTPRPLFEGQFRQVLPSYDVSRDGERFLMVQQGANPGANQIHVVVNWFEELKRRVPKEKR